MHACKWKFSFLLRSLASRFRSTLVLSMCASKLTLSLSDRRLRTSANVFDLLILLANQMLSVIPSYRTLGRTLKI